MSTSPPFRNFDFVHINSDGQVRELSPKEIEYLSTEFHPTDSGRPYVKPSYESRNGWGSISGFLKRSQVPANLTILPVNPEYDRLCEENPFDMFSADREAGSIITHNDDGTITVRPNPAIPHEERLERWRSAMRRQQEERDRMSIIL